MKLEVGGKYRSKNGMNVEIVGLTQSNDYPYEASYSEGGEYLFTLYLTETGNVYLFAPDPRDIDNNQNTKEKIKIGEKYKNERGSVVEIIYHNEKFNEEYPYIGVVAFGDTKGAVNYYNEDGASDLGYNLVEKYQEWYNRISEQGVLCWVCKEEDRIKTLESRLKYCFIMVVTERDEHGKFLTKYNSKWEYAKPVTKEELENFILDNNNA